MPVTFWWDQLGPSKQDLGLGEIGSIQVSVLMPGCRRVIFEPSAEVYFSTCKRWNDSVPIHRFPVELLSYIFLLAITPRDLERDPSAHPLARVCSLWRDIILDTPAFWTTISNLSSRNTVELKLELSRNRKLDFVYSERAGSRGPFLKSSQFKRLIGRNILRCNSLRIRVSSSHWSYRWSCPNSWRSRIPLLAMESADNSSKEVSWHLIPEEVQNVCLENIRVSWIPSSFPKLLSLQITSLAEAVSEVWEIRTAFSIVTDILRASPCLKALKLVGAFRHQYRFHANDMLIQGEISTFPSLESLEMEGSSSYLFWQVLDTFEFPSLSKLVIYPNHLDPYSGRTIDSVCRDIGGRSSLQSIIDRANCERLTIRIRRGPSPVITIQGMNDAGKVIDLDPLTGDSSTNTILKVLKAIKSPVHIEISGETDGSFIQSIKNTSTIASLRYLPNSQEGGDL